MTNHGDEGLTLALPYDALRLPNTPQQHQTIDFGGAIDGLAQAEPGLWDTLERFLLAAFSTLLYRYTQQSVMAIDHLRLDDSGIPCSLARVAVEVDNDISLGSLMQQCRDRQPQAPDFLALDHYPQFSAAAFTYQETRPSGAAIAGEEPSACLTTADLHLVTWGQGPELGGQFRYNPHLFDPSTIERMVGHFNQILMGCAVSLDHPVGTVPLLTPGEEHQFQQAWSSAQVNYPQQPLFQAIERHALERPHAPAVRCQDQVLTYGELNQRANQLAHYLQQLGVGRGVPVASCFEPSPLVMVGLLAIFKVGGVYVPLDPSHPADRLAAMVDDTRPPIVLTQSHLEAVLPPVDGQVFCLDRDWPQVASQPTENLNQAVDLDQTAYIIYTSGTTGKPKGVMASHANLVNYIWSAQERYRFQADDVMPAMARFTFSITMFELWSPLVAGGTLLLLDRDHILDFKRMVQTLQQVTVVHMSPSLLRKLTAFIVDSGIPVETFSQLKHVSSGGDFVSADLLERMKQVFPQAEVYVIYGCSEISCMGCTYFASREQTITKSKVGKPFNNVSVRLYDAQKNRVPVGVVGEIHFGGAGITQGYLNREDLTQEKFITVDGDRLYCTGDLGRFDSQGNLEILGRSDYQIKLRGIRIEPGDIEATLRQAPGIREGVVVARTLPGKTDSSLVAYVVPAPDAILAMAEVRRFLQAKLPDYMVPSAFVVLDALPVNINQKVDRKALPEPTYADLVGASTFVAPRDDYEQKLVDIWQTVLGFNPIGVEDNFFDIGGDSLQSIALMVQIEAVFGKTLPLSTLLTEPTIAQLAKVLQDTKASDIHKSVVLLRQGGSKPPIFFIHDGEGETLLYRTLALSLDAEHPVYGIQPYSRPGFPMLHSRLDDVVDFYTDQILSVQPEGDYLLSGLCIGGFIAFEVARKLQQQGRRVKMVALIDAVHVKAPLRSGYITSQRRGSLAKAFSDSQVMPWWERYAYLAQVVTQKATNVITYELTSRAQRWRSQAQMKLFRYYLDRGLPLPKFLSQIPVQVVLRFAEKEYVIPQQPYDGEVLLFLATEKSSTFEGTEIDDTPYRDLYQDPLLGWEDKVTRLRSYEISGGHSSMLQKPNVETMAKEIQSYINQVL